MRVSIVPTVNGASISSEVEDADDFASEPVVHGFEFEEDFGVVPGAETEVPSQASFKSTVPPSNYGSGAGAVVAVQRGDFHSALLSEWQGAPYAELSIMASWLRALSAIHQSHHWQCQADPFYGDHQLYDRLYHQTNETVDRIAEKSVGLGCSDLVDPVVLTRHMSAIMENVYMARPGIPQPTDLAVRSLHAEKEYLKALDAMCDMLESKCLLTRGVDNMLSELADEAEGRVYLLKQRLAL